MQETILIIDDSPEIRENSAEMLELSGYKTLCAEDGKAGLELAKIHKPDLILCDINMPGLDGYSVLQALENIPGMTSIPFIFVTGRSELADLRKGMDLGADDYLTKPFNANDLLRIVAGRLKKNYLRKAAFENSLNDFKSVQANEENIDFLSAKSFIKKFKRKESIYLEGDQATFLYYVVSGRVKIFKSNHMGKELIINIQKKGDFFGYQALLENTGQCDSAMCIETCELALIPREDFLNLLYSDKHTSLRFLKLISKHLSEAEDKLLKLAYDSARKRVAEALLFAAKKYGNLDGGSFSFERENISSLAGISPESVSRHLTDFKEEGLLESVNGKISILDAKKLEKIKN